MASQGREQGSAGAQVNLGYMYDNSYGVPENNVEALKWYSLAKALGNSMAAKNLKIIQKEMTHAQITKAQELAAEWWGRTQLEFSPVEEGSMHVDELIPLVE